MRIRTVKPEFWHHEELSELSAESALLAIALLNYADDKGYFKYHAKLIESTLFPLRELSMTIHGMLQELSKIGYIEELNGSDGKKYGRICSFSAHQKVNKPSPSKIEPLIVEESTNNSDSRNIHGTFTEGSLGERKGKEQGKEGKGTGKGKEVETRTEPTIEDCEKVAASFLPADQSDFATSCGRSFFGIYAAQHWRTRGGDDLLKSQVWKHKLRTFVEDECRKELSRGSARGTLPTNEQPADNVLGGRQARKVTDLRSTT